MFFALVTIVGIILYCGFQNIANATPDDVTFNPVTIRNGAKIHVNGDKTLTAIDSGNKLVADNTNGTPVKGDQIESELNSFATNNYGDDTLFRSNTASNPKSLSEAEVNAFSQYFPATDGDYWLSDTGAKGSITWKAYVKAKNSLTNNILYATGQVDGMKYDETPLVKGPYAFDKDVKLSDYVAEAGGVWDLDRAKTTTFYVYQSSSHWLRDGDKVYNNMQLLDSGFSENGYRNKSTTIRNMESFGSRIMGYIRNGRIIQVKLGDVLSAGTTVVCCFNHFDFQLTDNSDFPGINGVYTGFANLGEKITVKGLVKTQPVYGMSKFYSSDTKISAKNIVSNNINVRPSFEFNSGKANFIRDNTSGVSLSTSSSFGDVPSSSESNNEDKKLVIKAADTTITNSLADSKLSTEKSANNHAVTKYTNGVIRVPYGAKTLSIDSSAFSTSNANYISALADVNGTKKYAVLGRTGNNLEIDLASIVNNNQVGSKATVSFYAEQANPANTSDVISETLVTVEIEVVEGPEQTIRYDLGGGTGTLPSNVTVKAGRSYTMADGSGLSKDGNLFSCWQLVYAPYGETDEVTRLAKANEAIIVPDTANGIIKATAMYSGVNSVKSTDSKSSVVTVTWDSNAPGGTTAAFTDSTGTYNDDKSIRYDKIKMAGSSIAVPGAPSLSVTTKIFDGWYDAKEGGNKVMVSVTPSVDMTYYAHWLDGYKVTYVVTGGDGATQTGKWSDETITDVEESVLPGASTVGPSKGTPVPDNSSCMFYGWYTQPNGGGTEIPTGTSFDDLGGSKTVYAYYGSNTFLAPATSTVVANPINIQGNKYSVAQIQAEARDIATNGSSSQYYSKYKAWMNDDSYHLYTLLNGKDANKANSWLECRIIHVGQHDNDGTGITFQAVHALPELVAYDSDYSGAESYLGNWSSSTLRSFLNNTFKNSLPTSLQSSLAYVTKLSNKVAGQYPVAGKEAVTTSDNLWVLSFTEYVRNAGTVAPYYWGVGSDAHDGSTYAFWDSKYLVVNQIPEANSVQAKLLLALNSDRAGNVINYKVDGSEVDNGRSWQRSLSPNGNKAALTFTANAYFEQETGMRVYYELCVIPCFAL